jgi:hypothetical protein
MRDNPSPRGAPLTMKPSSPFFFPLQSVCGVIWRAANKHDRLAV